MSKNKKRKPITFRDGVLVIPQKKKNKKMIKFLTNHQLCKKD